MDKEPGSEVAGDGITLGAKLAMGTLIDLYNLAKFAQRHPLAGRNKIAILNRFLRWQFGSLILRQPCVVPYVGGTRLILSKQMPGAAANYYFGLPEVDEVSLALHFLRQDELLGDIGANIGPLSIAAAGVSGARVIAMEPVPFLYEALVDNININRLQERVTAYRCGAGAEASTFRVSANRGVSNRIMTDGSGLAIEVKPLDAVFEDTPNMLVVDVEGFEPAVVQGAQRLLADNELRIVILETLGLSKDYGLDEARMHQTMLAHDFRSFNYRPNERRLIARKGVDRFNTIYVRDFDFVAERLVTARPFMVGDHTF